MKYSFFVGGSSTRSGRAYRSLVGLAQDLHHLLFAKPGLLHGSLAARREPSSQESTGLKITQQVKPTPGNRQMGT
jgi:hypothetical protein